MSEDFDWHGARLQPGGRAGSAVLYDVGESTHLWLVRFQDKNEDEAAALYHPDVPALRSTHPTRQYLWCSSKTARQADGHNGQIWEVTCNYSLHNGALLPWNEPAIYSISQQSTEQIVDRELPEEEGEDEEPKPIRNSAGCPFDPGVTATRFEFVMTVSRNELASNFNLSKIWEYVGAVNDAKFYGVDPGFCMCVGIPAVTQWHVDENTGIKTKYWSVQYIFAFRNQWSWQPKVLDAGYFKLNEDEDGLIPITIAGREPSSPVPLDGEGKPLENPEEDEPHWLDFTIYPKKNFSALNV